VPLQDDLRLLDWDGGYDAMRQRFAWPAPERFNIATAVCDKWADEPDRLALIHKTPAGQVERITFGELIELSNRAASLFRDAGIGRGDRVGLLLPQRPETAICHLGLYKLGAVAVPLAMLFGVEALEYRLNNCGARALVTTDAGMARIAPIRHRLAGLATVLDVDGDFHRQLAAASPAFTAADTGPDDPALMVYTSGTTGPPKGALHGHRVLIGHLPCTEFVHEGFPLPDDLMWTPADWAWAGGLLNILLPGLYYGVPVLAHRFEKFDPDAAFALMAEFGVRNTFIPPTALKMMRAVPEPARRHDLKLRTIGSGGESLGRELVDWGREALGLTINEFYGQTECNLVLSSCSKLGITRPGAIGRPVPGHEVAVIDGDGRTLGPGELGIVAVKRPDPVMFLTYWDNPQATADKYIGDWLVTGDQGMVDDDGYVHFVGRDDDVITSAGYRIGPGEIEDCLIGHPAVAMAAAVGKPDPERTEIVKAFIVLNDGYAPSPVLAAEIQAWVRERLSAHEYPREIAFEDTLPLTTTGKVIRRLLREKA
jgi:acetyl-CoA synthetase